MFPQLRNLLFVLFGVAFVLAGCTQAPPGRATSTATSLRVVASTSFLAEMTQQVAGDLLTVRTLLPLGVDPHGFQPTPADVALLDSSDLLIVNGNGLESFLTPLLRSGQVRRVVEASAGLTAHAAAHADEAQEGTAPGRHAIHYVDNIAAALSELDPAHADQFSHNAAAYKTKLAALDEEIEAILASIPAANRKLLTNHQSFNYFADRYGFTVVGSLIPSTSVEAAPSARDVATIIDRIRATGARAILLEEGADSRLAERVAADTGIKLVGGLYTHSLTDAAGPVPTYEAMMRYNAGLIANALR